MSGRFRQMRNNVFAAVVLASIAYTSALGETAHHNEGAIGYFSPDYQEARKKFLDAAQTAGASVESFRNPNAGPEGGSIFTDVALIGPKDAKAILVLGSGTHGVEGFAGSGIQTGLLKEGIASSLKPNSAIVIVHAINPYGFAHLRRFNENNVDLNRNFVDHAKPYPRNQRYEDLVDAICPKSISRWADLKSRGWFFWYGLVNGRSKLKEAITGGQYAFPKCPFYGGHAETWSNKTMRDISNRYLAQADRVVIVDFHTGLGPYGHGEVIMNVPKESPAYKRAVRWWGDRVRTTVDGGSVSSHLYGTVKLAFPRMLPGVEVTAASLEFGTYPGLEVFWAIRAENWLQHHGDQETPETKKRIKSDLLRAFYPDKEDWKTQVWNQGKEVVEEALAHLK